jgi:hypothetical protein
VTRIEELARIIAAAVTGLDPDTRTVSYHPLLMNNVVGYIVPSEYDIQPLWFRFREAAERAIEAGFDRPESTPAGDDQIVAEADGDPSVFVAEASAHAADDSAWNDEAKQKDYRDEMGLR